MIEPFACTTRAARVVFGANALAQLSSELDRLGIGRLYLVATPGRRAAIKRVTHALGARVAAAFTEARAHVPVETVARARDTLGASDADGVLALGGGSAIGLAKALARERGLRIAAVPTTYSGSEMTDVWGMTSGETKQTGRDPRAAAALVIYDPLLTRSLPPQESAASGMNAIAHCVEALYAPDQSPMAALFATEGLRLLAGSLPTIVSDPANLDARSRALLGAHFAGQALQLTTMGLHHRLCHVLGGFGLPHAPTHAILLPHVVDVKAPVEPRAMAAVAAALGASDAATGLHFLQQTLGITQRLRDVGFQQGMLDAAAHRAASGPGSADQEKVARSILLKAY